MATVGQDVWSTPMARAFTLVELVVTLVVVALVLGFTIPRVATLVGRSVSGEADAVAGLLSNAAGRVAVASQPLRVVAEADRVVVERRVLERDGQGEAWAWQRDPFMPAVRLNRGTIDRAAVDGTPISGPPFIAELGGGRSVELGVGGGDRAVTVALFGGALRAVVIEGDVAVDPPGRVDLDALGMGSTPW